MTHCSASVPDDDPNRQRFVELEKTGAQYSAELATLRASGAFEEYSRWDAANDTLLREDPILSKGNSVGRAVAGAAGAASGFGLAVVSTPACITGVGCALPVLAGVGGAASFLDGVQATRDYFAPYEYTQGQRVADSFSSQTYPGDVNPIKDYGTTAAKYALQVALIKGAGKLAAGPGSSVLVEGVPGGGAKGIGEASGSAKNFSIADRVFGQLNDPRMGQLAGKLDADALQKLANNPSATRFMDARTGHINVIQEVKGKLIRITVPRDEMKIISVGPIRPNQVKNLLSKGDFVPLP